MPERPLAYSVAEAARQLPVSIKTVRMVKNGDITHTRIGRRIIIPHSALAAVLRSPDA